MNEFFLGLCAIALVLALAVWPVALKFGAKPFSLHQKLGIVISIIALLSFLFLPFASWGSVFKLSLSIIGKTKSTIWKNEKYIFADFRLFVSRLFDSCLIAA